MKLIIINVGVFALYHFIHLFFFLFAATDHFMLDKWLAAPSDLNDLAHRPWTLITYMFFHEDFFHLLFNMLCLYWFGRIFCLYFRSSSLINVYLLGGIFGVVSFIAAFNIFPAFTVKLPILGASASVLAIVLGISLYVPKYTLNMLFIGPVKLIYIAAFIVFFDIVSISMSNNAGGHIAHLGGALFGYLFTANYRKGKDITIWLDKFFGWCGGLLKPKPKMKIKYKKPPVDDWEYNKQKKNDQAEVDRILDKISIGGYDCLTKTEKETLFSQKK